MTPSDAQAKAISTIVTWYRGGHGTGQEFYLAGYAGTGKTTLAKMVINELAEHCRVGAVRVGAFTGKAASMLRRKGLPDAMTVHSMIYTPVEDEDGNVTFVLAPDAPAADAELIVLDEVSMINNEMADDVRSYGKKILVIGDPGQLPPIHGHGAFQSREPDVFLTEIHRQAADSPIIRLATMARRDQPIAPGDYGDDVQVAILTPDTLPAILRPDTQVVCGLHQRRWAATQRIRHSRGFQGAWPAKGERLICRRNRWKLGIYNGEQGDVLEAPEQADGHLVMSIKMDDLALPLKDLLVHPYLFAQHFHGPSQRPRIGRGVNEFDWGYVLTVHSAQGSEWPHVTIIDDSTAFREDRTRHLYTALTRASCGLTLLKRTAFARQTLMLDSTRRAG